jgi:hypothetical protein
MNNWLFVGFQAYINEMHGSRSKIPSKNLVRQRCAEGFNSGVKGLSDRDKKGRVCGIHVNDKKLYKYFSGCRS